ncbi:MAG: hypothetical protein PF501_00215 [Salinisphaera sp.]|nr:hypothetical protein [Salinisphaera sp.]
MAIEYLDRGHLDEKCGEHTPRVRIADRPAHASVPYQGVGLFNQEPVSPGKRDSFPSQMPYVNAGAGCYDWLPTVGDKSQLGAVSSADSLNG